MFKSIKENDGTYSIRSSIYGMNWEVIRLGVRGCNVQRVLNNLHQKRTSNVAKIYADISILPMTEIERAYVRAALSYAHSNIDDLIEVFGDKIPKPNGPIYERLLAVMDTTPVLTWTDYKSYQSARVGTSDDDCVDFCLSGHVTCYRRGPWRLLITVCEGENHTRWGCFDDADQPQRYYHSEAIAKAEADAIARVLLADRKKVK